MPVFEDDEEFNKWWVSARMNYFADAMSREALAYEAFKAGRKSVNTLPDSVIAREEFLDNFNA